MTGLRTPTICTIVYSLFLVEVFQAIVYCLWDQEIASLMSKSKAHLCKKMHEMEEAWQFPYSLSAFDGCHIPTKCPACVLEYSHFEKLLFGYFDGNGGLQISIYLG